MSSLLSFFKAQMFRGFVVLLCLFPLQAGALSNYSNRELEELEKEFVKAINQSSQVERNPLLTHYVNQLGARLSKAAKIENSSFFLVKSPEINAFAGPGGHIGINTALIIASANESELAAVIAHELAHVRLHHIYHMIEHQKQMRIPMLASMLASLALGVVNPTLGSGALMASMGGMAQDSINFTRAREKEADRIGIDMLIRAGFNPRAMASFFKKMQQNARYYYTANIPAILRTHPLDDERIAEADNRSLHLPQKSYPDNLDYQLVKETVRVSTHQGHNQLSDYYQHSCHAGVACAYGEGMRHLFLNHFQEAATRFERLLAKDPNNFFFHLALAEAELGLGRYEKVHTRLKELHQNHPENYALLRAYAHSLMASGDARAAVSVLLKGQRQFKKDLPLCEELAKAQAAASLKAYAYFTESQCQLLQDRPREAMRQLKLVKSMAKNDQYLYVRAAALMEEIQFMQKE